MTSASNQSPSSASAEVNTPPNWRRRIANRIIGKSFVGQMARLTMLPVLVYLGIFAFAFWRAWVDPDGSAAYFAYIRNLIDIMLSMTAIAIFVGIGIFIVQVARFINLLRSEIKPITHDAKQAVKTVRDTSEFVQKQAIEPIIKTQSFIAGLIAFLRELSHISAILRSQKPEAKSPRTENDTELEQSNITDSKDSADIALQP